MIRTKRIESSSPSWAVSVLRWDDETGEAVKIVYDDEGRTVRRAVVRRFPRELWEGDVVGETTWFDGEDRILRRTPVLLGRSLALD
jgi:hypothetical protein